MSSEVKDRAVEGVTASQENHDAPAVEHSEITPARESIEPNISEEEARAGVMATHENKDAARLQEAVNVLGTQGQARIEGLEKPLDLKNPEEAALDLIEDVKGPVNSGRRWRILTDAINALRRFVLGGRKITKSSNVIHAEHRFGTQAPGLEENPRPEKAE